ncbi:MAG: hypothetical protein HQK49_19605 [Oligoflexia bacterium]|nr:hypothetical protein [Oligoflexia bacterium]
MKSFKIILKEIKDAPENKIEKVLAHYNWLASVDNGCEMWGNCPSGHVSERQKCFHISNDVGLYHCFSCGASGDVFNLIMLLEKCSFAEAVRIAAKRAGKDIDIEKASQLERESKEMSLILTDAASYCHKTGMEEEWFPALMLQRYGLTASTLEKYKIGYCSGQDLYDHLIKQGHRMEMVLSSGLFYMGTHGPVEVFGNRITFPYFFKSDVKYFIGRITHHHPNKDAPKYTKLATGDGSKADMSHPSIKNDIIYGEDSIIGDTDIVLGAEGVTDALMALQLSIPTISAVTLKFNKAQFERLSIILKNRTVIVVGDRETSGIGENGALYNAAKLYELGITVKIAEIPERTGVVYIGQDFPPTFTLPLGKRDFNDWGREEGIKAWEVIKTSALPYPEYKILKILKDIKDIEVTENKIVAAFENFLILPEEELENIAERLKSKFKFKEKEWDKIVKKILKKAKKHKGSILHGELLGTNGILLNSDRMYCEVLKDVESHVSNYKHLFSHGNVLVAIKDDQYKELIKGHEFQSYFSRNICESYIEYIEEKDDGTKELKRRYLPLPEVIAKSIASTPWQFGIKDIQVFSRAPILNLKYERLSPGYNVEEKAYYAGTNIEPVKNDQSIIKSFLLDWPWEDEASFENFLASCLFRFISHHHPGSIPSCLILGNQQGLGKSFLAFFQSLIFEGEQTTPISLSKIDDDELTKQIVSILLTGKQTILFDNIKSKSLASPVVEVLLTSPRIGLRILGSNKGLNQVNTTQVFFTLNEGNVCKDIIDRSIPIKLKLIGDPKKKNWKYPDFTSSVLEHREQIIAEFLGMWAKWCEAGKPLSDKRHRFIKFGHIIGGVLEVNGYTNFLNNLENISEERDDLIQDFMELITILQLNVPYTASEIADVCVAKKLFINVLDNSNRKSLAIKCSNLLSRFIGRQFVGKDGESITFTAVADKNANANKYLLKTIEESPEVRNPPEL